MNKVLNVTKAPEIGNATANSDKAEAVTKIDEPIIIQIINNPNGPAAAKALPKPTNKPVPKVC